MSWEFGIQPYTGILVGVFTEQFDNGWAFYLYLPLIAFYFEYTSDESDN